MSPWRSPATGSGATATATVGANGAVTGLTLTNPGSGYTTADVTFDGAGNRRGGHGHGRRPRAPSPASRSTPPAAGYTAPTVSFAGGGGTGTLVQVGNALIDRAYATDYPT